MTFGQCGSVIFSQPRYALSRHSSSHSGSSFLAEMSRTMSSVSPCGMLSASMSVTKPYLYSRLTSVSTDELLMAFPPAERNRTWYSQVVQPLRMCSRRAPPRPGAPRPETGPRPHRSRGNARPPRRLRNCARSAFPVALADVPSAMYPSSARARVTISIRRSGGSPTRASRSRAASDSKRPSSIATAPARPSRAATCSSNCVSVSS